ncbi:hypothetical protein Baya_16051 [Bagarius yarrelli]|uniref:Ig-like domain-containing protein n=1 Tax=Bagarius yarrelli TaxID=175774 RepID=A0A556VU93_BAGYA|nr:hypothetical protein Baya_16051 [Bagarius yarrelli]
MEGDNCLLQCNVQNVAPVQYLELTLYRQKFRQPFPVWHLNFNEFITTPVNKSIDILVHSSRNDDGAQYWCEAKLKLGPEGPQPLPVFKSQPLNIAIHYKPMFLNDTEILEAGEEELTLKCFASANPPSVYIWTGRSLEREVKSSLLSVSYPGNYTCIASNPHGKAKKLFIIKPKYHENTTFWIMLGVGLALAVALIIGYIIIKRGSTSRGSANLGKSSSPSVQKEEGQELVSTVKCPTEVS